MTSGHDQPLTRRQLRELERQQAESADGTSAAGPSVVADAEPADAPAVEPAPAADEQTPDDELTNEPAPDKLPERTLTRRELRIIVEDQQAHEADELADSTESDAVEAPAPVAAPKPAPPSIAAPPVAKESVQVSTPDAIEVEVEVESDEAKDTVAPPPEHWIEGEQHADALDLSEPFDEILARGITAAGPATTTSALIMPEMNSPTTGPVPITGEILVTGSIDLPRSLGSTGQHPNHFESSDVDKLMDGLDDAAQVADVAPVKASRAVSSHASTRGVMAPPTRSGGNLPTVLAITAGVLTLAVIGLFIAGFVFNAF